MKTRGPWVRWLRSCKYGEKKQRNTNMQSEQCEICMLLMIYQTGIRKRNTSTFPSTSLFFVCILETVLNSLTLKRVAGIVLSWMQQYAPTYYYISVYVLNVNISKTMLFSCWFKIEHACVCYHTLITPFSSSFLLQ